MPSPEDPTAAASASSEVRLEALERQVAAMRSEIEQLRSERGGTTGQHGHSPFIDDDVARRLRQPPHPEPPPRRSFAERVHMDGPFDGDAVESFVGRYVAVALGGLVMLMAVGAMIRMAVQHGLLTPEIRVLAGCVAAVALAVAGVVFRRRGDTRYGNVLLALALAVVDLVAWGAGPRFHVIPTSLAFLIIDVMSFLLAALAVSDSSEFLFAVAVGGALSAPFVTSDGGGSARALLGYGALVIAGSLRSVRDESWWRAFAVLVGGAVIYVLAAAQLPLSAEWYGPFLLILFSTTCAAAALVLGPSAWRSELSRAFLASGVVGVVASWDVFAHRPLPATIGVAVVCALITYAALLSRADRSRYWTSSALILPFLSLGVAYAASTSHLAEGTVIAGWTLLAAVAWRLERADMPQRASTHLLAAMLLGVCAVGAWWFATPLALVGGLAAWGVVSAVAARGEESPLPLLGVGAALTIAALSAVDQLASRNAYSYVPFMTRSSASAALAAAGLGLAGLVIAGGSEAVRTRADRAVRLGALVGFLIVWGRMEVADAFSHDVSEFLLASYYAACGVASILVGRLYSVGRLRAAGLGLAIYAAVKAVLEVTDISSLLLRVGAYAAVGVFLLGAGYLYRDRSTVGTPKSV